MGLTVLVTGASGFVGSHVARALVDVGHEVRAMTRRARELVTTGPGTPVAGDVEDPKPARRARGRRRGLLPGALPGRPTISSAGPTPGRAGLRGAAARSGVDQIVYLGGLGSEDGRAYLGICGPSRGGRAAGWRRRPLTVLRAGDRGRPRRYRGDDPSAREAHLPAMVTPRMGGHPHPADRSQDVVRYLVGVLEALEADRGLHLRDGRPGRAHLLARCSAGSP